MSLLKNVSKLVVFFFCLSLAYLGTAVATSTWNPELNLDSQYRFTALEKRSSELRGKFMANPLAPVTLTLTESEIEGLLKDLIMQEPALKKYVKGVGLSVNKSFLLVTANMEMKPFKFHLTTALQPLYDSESKSFVIQVNSIKAGRLPLSPRAVLYLTDKLYQGENKPVIKDGSIAITTQGLPLDVAYLKLENKAVQAAFSLSSNKITQMAVSDGAVVKNAVEVARRLEERLSSEEAKNFINSLKEKTVIEPADIEMAQKIFSQLSAQDKDVLMKNIREIIKNPALKEALARYGY